MRADVAMGRVSHPPHIVCSPDRYPARNEGMTMICSDSGTRTGHLESHLSSPWRRSILRVSRCPAPATACREGGAACAYSQPVPGLDFCYTCFYSSTPHALRSTVLEADYADRTAPSSRWAECGQSSRKGTLPVSLASEGAIVLLGKIAQCLGRHHRPPGSEKPRNPGNHPGG